MVRKTAEGASFFRMGTAVKEPLRAGLARDQQELARHPPGLRKQGAVRRKL